TLAALAVCTLAFQPPLAHAAEQGPPAFSLERQVSPQYLDEHLPSIAPGAPAALNTNRAPLMALLGQAGIVAGPLDQARINIYGHVEVSSTFNFNNPAK